MNRLENFALTLMAVVLMLAAAAWAATESGAPTELEAAKQTALAVADVDRKGQQVEGEYLFSRRVQLAGDAVCIRTTGPGTRAVWSGPDETLHCVHRDRRSARDRLMLAQGGER
ncbi:hypothetical protein [Curvibacter lanceolatus]|uniref:hypothetical protein n=1 Tax=Curvibacter lanceolatus TaxID=86182 RepID=UPI00037B96B4|nr:hypothetical protein [Curvibacter lanceolatus]